MDTHRFVVREISKQVKAFHEANKPFRIFHGDSYSIRPPHDPRAVVHTGDLRYILDINTESKFAMVEPNVTMDELVRATLRKGLLPPVVPGLKGLTVGGCFSGTAVGSSSFKYGYFEIAVAWVECVLPDGKITRASYSRNSDLLSCLVGTLGTVAVVTLLQITLVPAAKYVELTYFPVRTRAGIVETMERCCENLENDFVEGVVHGVTAETYGVVVVGRFLARKPKTKQLATFGRRKDPWFYLHAAQKTHRTMECVPIMDYLFRHDRGCFNLGRFAFGRVPFNHWTRWLADSAMSSRDLVRSAKALHWTESLIIQDFAVPVQSAPAMLGYLETEVKTYPIYLCPIRHLLQPSIQPSVMRANNTKGILSINLSIRGYTPATILDPTSFKAQHRDLEYMIEKLEGMKSLFSKNYYTEEEFWRIYSKDEYGRLREKYSANYLASVFEKSIVSEDGKRMRTQKVTGMWSWIFNRTGVLGMKHPPKDLS